ncbi:MAG: hypothetical protein A4E47_00347 [Methanosaeta sp. PtaU1.Bin028]|nr:MAG: hypothetical protein A4E47_00347 [Methanosaeta sp. PtaU1.Bin028]
MKGVALASIIFALAVACGTSAGSQPIQKSQQNGQYCENQKISSGGLAYLLEMVPANALVKDQREFFRSADPAGPWTTRRNRSDGLKSSAKHSTPPPVILVILSDDKNLANVSNRTNCTDRPDCINSIDCINSTNCSNSTNLTQAEIGAAPMDTAALGISDLSLQTAQNEDVSAQAYSPVHSVGMDTKISFNGTWVTDSSWHKAFYRDIKDHQMLAGAFEAEKSIKFHEAPLTESEERTL